MPPLAIANGLAFEQQPEELDLTQLEERLVAARIPFMQLRELPRGGQVSITGNVVNVPTDINRTTQILPRRPTQVECIPIKLKRKLQYKHHYLYEYVRPNKVLEAIRWLTNNSALYQQEGIVIDEDWEEYLQADFFENSDTENNNDNHQNVEPIRKERSSVKSKFEAPNEESKGTNLLKQTLGVEDTTEADTDVWERDTGDDNAGPFDTLLQAQDIIEDTRDILSLAPAEGSRPVSIFLDKNAESLAFPTLYCGKQIKAPKDYDVTVHYTDLCKSELRRSDRRVAGHIPDLFFKLKKVQMKHILDKANICLRKTTASQKTLTAGFFKSSENLKQIIHADLGFRIFRDLRGSPPYWEKVKKDLFAMIRSLGIPTWFASFSSAGTRWPHLLQILGEVVDKKTYSEEEIQQFSWFKKQELVKKDPVTCARHFEYQFNTFLGTVLKNSSKPVGEVVEFFYKVEFQQRGSPHIHMLIWVNKAPKYEEDDEKDVVEYIDKFISCQKSEELGELTDLQSHNHSRTCKKNNKPVCRFGFPIPPMEETVILQPFQLEIGEDEQKHKKNWEKVSKFLYTLKKDHHELDFCNFLALINLTKDEYLKAVRSTLTSPKIFLKRSLAETRVNNYNPLLLKCWRANMDLQYVLDAYSCAMYIVSYISKSQRGMSNLLYHAAKEAREGNNDIREQVKFIGNKFLNNVEVSAQEAVFTLLQIPLYKSSTDVIFVNTSPLEKRTVMLKDQNFIEKLPSDSEDVFAEGIVQYYSKRPTQLEDLCLADYVSKFRRQKTRRKNKQTTDVYESDCEENETSEVYDLGGGYELAKRRKPVCIRYVRFHPEKEAEEYYRECLMLFHPWRNEDRIIGKSSTYQKQFLKTTEDNETMVEKMNEYKHKSNELDDAMETLKEIDEDNFQDQWDQVAPNTQHVEAECVLLTAQPTTHDGQKEDSSEAVELNVGLGCIATDPANSYVINMMKDADYYKLVRSMNCKQIIFFYYVMDKVKVSPYKPFHAFLTGGAGVGKTAVTNAVYQMLLRYLNRDPGSNPDDLKVLLGAPTGKAAFLIKGNTLHHIFHIPASQGFTYKRLSNDKRNSLRCKFSFIRVLIIDECSMVGNRMLNFINLRLQEVMGNVLDFGGLSVIAVGDFYQLKPVFDDWIFSNLTENYGPLARNLWKDLFQVYCLTEIMRQKDDTSYAELLNRLRTGHHTKQDVDLLKTRIIDTSIGSSDYPRNIPHIFMTNERVEGHNDMVYTLSREQDKIQLKAWDVIVGDVSEDLKAEIIQRVPSKLTKTMGLSKTLHIAIKTRVEIATNIDVEDGLSNGASGIVMGISHSKTSKKGVTVWVKFDDERIGFNHRQANKDLYTTNIPKSWTPLQEIKRQFPVGRYKNAEVLRAQIPLRPASAKTAHRCQGDTMDAAVVDFERARSHSHYVALSRVKSLDQVYIRTFNEEKISVSQQVQEEMNRLMTERMLQHSLTFPADICQENCTVLFHNVRSLHAHYKDISNDPNFKCAHVNIFVETKLSTKDCTQDYTLTGYDLYRHDCQVPSSARSAYGIAVYSKADLQSTDIQTHRQSFPNAGVIESVTVHVAACDLHILAVYASPKVTSRGVDSYLQQRMSSLKGVAVIVLGDFNVDLNKTTLPFKSLSSYRQCIESPTTDYGSLLDHLYTNIEDKDIQTGVFESYFSDHKPIWASVKNDRMLNDISGFNL